MLRNGDTAIVKALIADGFLRGAGFTVNDRNRRYRQTALYCASRQGHEACVDILLNADANVNITERNGSTPLHGATHAGHIEACFNFFIFSHSFFLTVAGASECRS